MSFLVPPPRIMVVDDDVDLRECLGECLLDEGYEVVCVDSGQQALDWLHRSPTQLPQLILLDLMMPRMNGWQFRREQLDEPDLAGIPVIVMTASRNLRENPVEADLILFKPVTLDDLLGQITRLLPPC